VRTLRLRGRSDAKGVLAGLIHRGGLRAWVVIGENDLRGGRSFRMKVHRRQEKLSIPSAPTSSEFMIHLHAFRSRCERLVVAQPDKLTV
jgi:hypothetical protein